MPDHAQSIIDSAAMAIRSRHHSGWESAATIQT